MATTSGGAVERTVWADKVRTGMYRVWANTGNGAHKTNELILVAPVDVVWEKPAVYDMHYDEIRLK